MSYLLEPSPDDAHIFTLNTSICSRTLAHLGAGDGPRCTDYSPTYERDQTTHHHQPLSIVSSYYGLNRLSPTTIRVSPNPFRI